MLYRATIFAGILAAGARAVGAEVCMDADASCVEETHAESSALQILPAINPHVTCSDYLEAAIEELAAAHSHLEEAIAGPKTQDQMAEAKEQMAEMATNLGTSIVRYEEFERGPGTMQGSDAPVTCSNLESAIKALKLVQISIDRSLHFCDPMPTDLMPTDMTDMSCVLEHVAYFGIQEILEKTIVTYAKDPKFKFLQKFLQNSDSKSTKVFEFETSTKDFQVIRATATVKYSVKPDEAGRIFATIASRNSDVYQKIVQPSLLKALKSVFSQYELESIRIATEFAVISERVGDTFAHELNSFGKFVDVKSLDLTGLEIAEEYRA